VNVAPGWLTLFQLSDGLFPAGGFAHSFGLETLTQDGSVTDRAGLEAFVIAHLEGSAGPTDSVAVAVATRLATLGDVAGVVATDERLDAMKPIPEFRVASLQMGRQTLRVMAALEAGEGGLLGAFARAVDNGLTPGHHATVFGTTLGRAGVTPELAAAAYLHSTVALLVGAGLRLIALGQLDGQRVLATMRPRIARLAAVAAESDLDDLWSFNPGLELAGLRHATLEMRLFRS
jgi:urease accessory protein